MFYLYICNKSMYGAGVHVLNQCLPITILSWFRDNTRSYIYSIIKRDNLSKSIFYFYLLGFPIFLFLDKD